MKTLEYVVDPDKFQPNERLITAKEYKMRIPVKTATCSGAVGHGCDSSNARGLVTVSRVAGLSQSGTVEEKVVFHPHHLVFLCFLSVGQVPVQGLNRHGFLKEREQTEVIVSQPVDQRWRSQR